MAGSLDRHRQLPLMLGTSACLPPWANLATVGQEPPKQISLLIVDVENLLRAEETGLLASRKLPRPATTPPALPTASTTLPTTLLLVLRKP